MGLFSSKKETTVGTSVSRVIQNRDLPNSIKTGMVKSIFESGDIPDYIKEELVSGVAITTERMYAYAKKSYAYGLPSGKAYLNNQGSKEVQAVLEALEEAPVILDYSRYGPANNLHMGWMALVEHQNYNPVSNKLGVMSAEIKKDVYLKGMIVVIPRSVFVQLNKQALQQWGNSSFSSFFMGQILGSRNFNDVEVSKMVAHSLVKISDTASKTYVEVTGAYADPFYRPLFYISNEDGTEGQQKHWYITKTVNIPLMEYNEEADYFHAKYTVGDKDKYWMYEVESGVHESLDALFNAPPTATGSFFPFVYFRYNKTKQTKSVSTAGFNTSKKLLKYVGMDYANIMDAVHENPDIADVEQAMMIMAIQANSSNTLDVRYLFDFFSQQYNVRRNMDNGVAATHAILSFILSALKRAGNFSNALVIRDKRFQLSLSMGNISKKFVKGNIGKINTYKSDIGNHTESYEVDDHENGGKTTVTTNSLVHKYMRQRSSAIYEQVSVRSLSLAYHIYGKHNTVGGGADPNLLVPLDMSISSKYQMKDREILYSRSFQFVFNSRVVTKVKWYQQGWFADLLQIVGIVITIASMGSAGGIMAAISSLTAKALVMAIIKFVVINVGLRLFVKIVGKEFALLIAIVAAVYGMGKIINSGSIAGAPWAKELLQLSTGLSSSIEKSLKDSMVDLLKESEQFGLEMKEKTEALNTAQELLDGNKFLSPFIVFGESPNDFFNRTVHSGNIGVMGLDAITNYVDIALTLPDFNKTLGDDYNAT